VGVEAEVVKEVVKAVVLGEAEVREEPVLEAAVPPPADVMNCDVCVVAVTGLVLVTPRLEIAAASVAAAALAARSAVTIAS
jgi:hypothetical protein